MTTRSVDLKDGGFRKTNLPKALRGTFGRFLSYGAATVAVGVSVGVAVGVSVGVAVGVLVGVGV